MRLVKRTVTTVNERTHSKRERDHISYIPPNRLKVGDIIMKPSAAQIADLLKRYPDEYEGDSPVGLQVGPYKVNKDDAFIEIPWKDACEMVRLAGDEKDIAALRKYFEWEKARVPFRKSVMKALFEAGIDETREFFE